MKHQDRFKKKYKIDAIDFVEKADLEFFGVAKTFGIQSVLKSYAENKGMNIEFNDEFNKDLVEAFAEAGKKFPYNEKISFISEIYQLEPTPVNPPIPKSKGVLEDFKDIVSKDVFRENLSAIYVSDDGFLYGTDAHKLIRYKNNDYSEYAGKLINLKIFIDSKGKKLDFVDAKPLQYESVIPKNNTEVIKNLPTYNFYNFAKSVVAVKKLLSSDIFNVIFDFKGESFGFNPILMSDVFHFALCKGFDTFTLEYSTPNRAIIFNFKDDSLGLLMPIMVKEDSLMGTTKTTIEQIVSDYGYSKSMPKAKSEKATKVEVKEVPYTKFDGTIKDTTYIPRRDISYVVLKNGEQLSSSEIADGVYKINKKMATGGGVGEYKLNDNVDFYYGRADEKKVISGTISDILNDGYTISTGFTQVMVKPNEIVGYSKQAEPKKKRFGIFKDGGGVEAENKEMVLNNNKQIAHHTEEFSEAVKKAKYVPAWVVAKVNRSASDLSDATHYMEGEGESYANGGAIGDNVHITDEKSLMNNKSGFIIGDEGTFWLVKTLNGTGLVKKGKVKVIKEFATGGSIGFIPMDIEEKFALLAKWGGMNIREVIEYFNAMIDAGITDADLQIMPTKNTRFQRERSVEQKIKEIWGKVEPKYKGELKGNRYYSMFKELISRNFIYEGLLANFKFFRKNQNFATGGGVGNTFYALTSNGMQNKTKQKIQSISYWKGRQSTHKPTSENIKEFLSQVPFDEKICIYNDDDNSFDGQLHSAHVPLYTNGAESVDAIVDDNNNIIWNKYAGSKYEIKIENYKMETGGGVSNEIAEIKAKIEKAKKNTIMPENLKKQYIEKYEKQLAGLILKQGTKEDVKDFLEVPKGKTPKIVKVEPKGRVKLKEILIHWAEGDNSKYDKFPKKYKTWEAANKAIIPVYEDYAEEGGGGYNKVKFTVTFDDNENYDGRLDVSTKEDNPTKTHNVVGQHIKDYLDYQLSEKSRTSEAVKKEILEWLEKYDLGLKKGKEKATKVETKETTNVSKNYDYIPQRDIEEIKAKQGTIENKDILDGAYVKKGWKHKK